MNIMQRLIHADAPPLRLEDSGAIRVGASRVLLEIVLGDYLAGDAPETIAEGYPTLELADVHATIAYFLRHRAEMDEYLAERERLGEEVMAKIAARQGDLGELGERIRSARESEERKR